MEDSVIDRNLERIRKDLILQGLTYDPLTDDLLDHVCCMIESEMESGSAFESSYDKVMSVIEPGSIPKIQHQTLLLLDKKFQRMKNFTYLFGLSSALVTIIGAFFKRMHWPGAGILLTVGIAMVVLVFLPLYFIINYREQTEKKNPIFGIVGYLTLFLLLAGALFKIMHWPGAGILIEVSIAFLIVGFIPLYVVNVFQKGGGKKRTLPYIVMLMVGIALIMVYSHINMSKYLLDIYMEESLINETSLEIVSDQTAGLIELSSGNAEADVQENISRIHEKAGSLQKMITMMKEGMITFVEQPGMPINKIRDIDNRGAGREAIVDSGLGREFETESRDFREMLKVLVRDPVIMAQIEDHLEFTGKVWPYEHGTSNIVNDPLMKNYYKLTDASKGIALSEYVAIDYLLHQQ
ncbi:MAG: hypothetical protein JXR52_09840 [Bacteroidales bacterium]|nr:hypothetical protein [Bacteroidales bacterium]MBN2699118.1 hypothetical protein [Bacteroidales bacterium]